MSLEKNKAIIRKGIEEVNKHNLAIFDQLLDPEYVDHTNPINSPEEVKQFYTMIFKSFPDFHRIIEDIIAEGDKVWVRVKVTATHMGSFRGLAPTSKKITVRTANTYRMVNGKIVESWAVNDFSNFKKQLGVDVF